MNKIHTIQELTEFIQKNLFLRNQDFSLKSCADEEQKFFFLVCSLGLPEEVGEVIRIIKKSLRDNPDELLSDLMDEKREQLVEEMGDVLFYLIAMSLALGIDLQEIVDRSQIKLTQLTQLRNCLNHAN